MAIRKTNPNTEFRVGQIVMTQGLLTHGLCSWPCVIAKVNKSCLTLDRLRSSMADAGERQPVKYTKNIAYIADTEEEAFAFHEASMEHAKRAQERLRQLNEEIRNEGRAIVGQHVSKESTQ